MIDQFLAFFVGVGLAAAVGVRIFIPLLVVSISAFTNNLILSNYFTWMGSLPVIIILIVICVFETMAFFVPWLDNFLDAVEHPLSIITGIIITGAVIADFNPYIKWIFALIIGGAISGTINAATGLLRLKVSAESGGKNNFIFSTIEIISAIVLSLVSIFAPIFAGFITAICLIYFTFIIRNKFLSPAKNKD
ncbi:MAG: DUF4126 domain-containing protein [Ignavibacterium sp.]|nr:DUF4126 domain-containing protein [Ignavibacterium sp.]MCX7611384.1 DUF4126 domain-containing protein [Ignavibacterium sp.]MDW8375711.1 DUF4126 domain-containing protein [Ignavibacteriales bacterium]